MVEKNKGKKGLKTNEQSTGLLPVEEARSYPMAQKENVMKHRIAIFSKNWMEVSSLSSHCLDKHLKSWKKGQVVSINEDIERLKSMGAPIKVYIEDVID